MIVFFDCLSVVFLALCWWVAVSSYPSLPETIPVHFGISGEPDNWGGRWMIFLLPTIASLIVALDLFLFTRLEGTPKMAPAMKLPLHLMILELTALFAFITWRMSEVAFERAKSLGVRVLLLIVMAMVGTSVWIVIAGKIY
ncbi:MAG: DUF1648 domain-containing protein [Acidobacteria bacterium]|nr:DUF1648 domain-containing protein [Acidobacteriota bacterium]